MTNQTAELNVQGTKSVAEFVKGVPPRAYDAGCGTAVRSRRLGDLTHETCEANPPAGGQEVLSEAADRRNDIELGRLKMGHSVLLVDDEKSIQSSIEMYLREKKHDVYTASSVDEGLEMLEKHLPEVVIVDLKLPDKDGFIMIEELRRRNSAAAVIVISGYGDIQKAVRATKMGAHQFIPKPFSLADVEKAIEEAAGIHTCCHQLHRVGTEGVQLQGPGWTLLGLSEAMKDIYRKIQMVCRNSSATVLVTGESGTGKELVARAIFEGSGLSNGKFVDVNCAALTESLLEAELFGHEKGSFTGAVQTRKGLFEAADKGVIFLDEIGEMPLKLQSKLLRVLEEKSFKRVGGVDNIQIDFRIIASTNRSLLGMVEAGEFRRDLYYRLEMFRIDIPPLCERREDIPPLSSYFLRKFSPQCNKHFTGFSPAAMERLTDYSWPGNVRELRNVIERAVILGSGSTVHSHDLIISHAPSAPVRQPADTVGDLQSLEKMERELIRQVLVENNWQKARSAEILGINRTTLWHKIKRYGLEPQMS